MDKYAQINHIINRNPAKFSGRAKITSKWLQHTFSWLVPGLSTADRTRTNDVPKFVAAYVTINKVLAKRGLHLKARNYYTYFQLQNTKPTIISTIDTYARSTTSKRQIASELYRGFNKHRGIWSPLSNDELSSFRQ